MAEAKVWRVASCASVLITCFLSSACMAHNSESLQSKAEQAKAQAVEYVDGLAANCDYRNGYQCADAPPEIGKSSKAFIAAIDQSGTVSPMFLQTWPLAYDAFQNIEDLSDEQKQLKHYRIGFHYSEPLITIWFKPLLLPQIDQGEVVGNMRAHIGQDVRVIVDSASNTTKVVLGR